MPLPLKIGLCIATIIKTRKVPFKDKAGRCIVIDLTHQNYIHVY